jgi:hypothetical protein
MCSQSDDPSMHDDLDAESRKPGPTMTITKAQYGALVDAARPSDEVAYDVNRVGFVELDSIRPSDETGAWERLQDVQRYSLESDPSNDDCYMELDPEGRYVLFDEVVALDAARPSDEVTGLREAALDVHRAYVDREDMAWAMNQLRAALANTKEPDGG